MTLRALAYVLTVAVLLAGVGVVGLLAGPLVAFVVAVVLALVLWGGWDDHLRATAHRKASR